MLNEKELEVLKNAPDWAKYYIENINGYCGYIDFGFERLRGADLKYNIADLRKQKEQNDKTMKIVAAVNELMADLDNCHNKPHHAHSFILRNNKKYYRSNTSGVVWETTCTFKEFNKYIKDMSDAAGHNKFVEYSCSEKQVVTNADSLRYVASILKEAEKELRDSVKSDVVDDTQDDFPNNNLPDVGSKCLYNVCNASSINIARHGCVMHVAAHNKGLAVLVSEDGKFSTMCNSAWTKPIETAAQKAAKERDAKIQKLVDLYYLHNTGNFLETHDVMNVVSVLVDNCVIGKGE